ncbi:MAG: hypothetical protein HYY08_03725 [Firmicutes bacterium]|nr:hypothetical protein [Bacillota bacterium]
MNYRERYLETARFGRPDRTFLMDQWFWKETERRWWGEGLPRDVHAHKYFGFDRREYIPLNLGLLPAFDVKVLEADRYSRVVVGPDGAKKREFHEKPELSMPQWLEYPVRDRSSWEEYKKRLNPGSPGRYPAWWDDYVRCVRDRDYPLGIAAGSFYGWIRNWMGVENLSVALYDDPSFVRDMAEYIADFVCGTIHRALDETQFDFAAIWEDMAMKTGPLISPRQFRELMLPACRRVVKLLRSHGVDIILVDSDGNVDQLIPLWLEVGVTGVYPLEVAAGEDAVRLRREYGRDLMLVGNIDKRALATSKQAIEAEVLSKVPWLVMQGGYFPWVDHGVPPDVPYENFLNYLELLMSVLAEPERHYHTARQKGLVLE